MIPKIIHFTTKDSPSKSEIDAIQLARELHPNWDVKVWKGDAIFRGGRLYHYYSKASHGGQLADLIRLDVLKEFGGVYLDADFRLVKPLDELISRFDFFVASEDGYNLTNAVIGASMGHAAIDSIISFLEKNEPDWSAPGNETTGPVLFSRLLRWRSDVAILPRELFYPYNWNETPKPAHRLSIGVHLWEGSWVSPAAMQQTNVTRQPIWKLITKRILKPIAIAAISFVQWTKQLDAQQRPIDVPVGPHSAYECCTEVVVRTVHGQKLIVDGYDLSVTPDLATTGIHEWPEECLVRRVVKGGDWFVDVGANVGVFSILAAAQCGPFGRVLAFEPNPRIGRLLNRSTVMNWMHDRITVYSCALSDRVGTAKLTFCPGRLGDAKLESEKSDGEPFSATAVALGDRAVIDVPIQTLDSVIDVDVPIKFLKIDAEGHEAEVLAGASRLLRARAFDYIMLEAEVENAPNKWATTVIALQNLIDLGYTACSLTYEGRIVRHNTLSEAIHAVRPGKTFVFTMNDLDD